MGEVTISSKYQIVIPREVRKQLGLKAGQKLKVLIKGQVINLVPEVPLSEMRGFLKGMDASGIRENEEHKKITHQEDGLC
jgi:AbrB family looped-hinge helix DNA binding protein